MTVTIKKPIKKTTNEVFASIDQGLNSGDYLSLFMDVKEDKSAKLMHFILFRHFEVQIVGMRQKKINTLKECLIGTTAY